MDGSKKILMIYVEPTPYIVGLINVLQSQTPHEINILFLRENATQDWGIARNKAWLYLPSNPYQILTYLINVFFKQSYDLIHVAGWGHSSLLLCIVLAKIVGIPLVSESDTALSAFTKRSKHYLKKIIYPIFFKLFNLFLAGGQKQSHYLQYFSVPEERITVVQMTVDVKGMQQYAATLTYEDRINLRAKYKINSEDIVFLYVGRLTAIKGIKDLLQAFNKINAKNMYLFIVGDGEMRSMVETAADENAQIRYVGRLADKELIQAYFLADILILPSHFEAWGLVVNEAMAMGLSVIVSDRVGCIDDLVNAHTGLVYPAGDISALECAIRNATINSNDRLNRGKKALEKIADWTLENEAHKINNAWGTLLCN